MEGRVAAPRSLVAELAAALGLVVLITPVLFSLKYHDLFHSIGNNPVLSFAIAGAFVIHMFGRPPRMECALTIALAVVLRFAYASITPGGFAHYFGYAVVHWGSFLGIASLIVLAVRAVRDQGEARKFARSDLLAGGAFFYYWIIIGIALFMTDHLIKRTCDQFLYAFDSSLGFQPSFQLGQLIWGRPVPGGLVSLLYYAIPLPVALLYASQRRQGYADGYKIFPLLIAASTGGYLLYYFVPGTGPIYEFMGKFPFHIPPVSPYVGAMLPISERAVRNAMPSLHLGTALMVCWNCRIWPRAARVCVWLFFFLTAFATLALGQHYLVDLVVAFPVMLAFHAAAVNSVPLASPARWLPIAAGLGATFAWLALLRYGIGLCLAWPALSWTLVVGTLAGASILEARLARAAVRERAQRDSAAPADLARSVHPTGSRLLAAR